MAIISDFQSQDEGSIPSIRSNMYSLYVCEHTHVVNMVQVTTCWLG